EPSARVKSQAANANPSGSTDSNTCLARSDTIQMPPRPSRSRGMPPRFGTWTRCGVSGYWPGVPSGGSITTHPGGAQPLLVGDFQAMAFPATADVGLDEVELALLRGAGIAGRNCGIVGHG